MLFNQVGTETIMPGGDRGMSSENHFAGNSRHGLVECETFFLHAIANSFEHREAAVALVQMKHSWSDAHGFQGAETADAEQ